MQLCEYGCNQEAKFQLKNGKWCCSKHFNSCPRLKRKNSEGLKKAYKEGRKSYSDFGGKRGWAKGLNKDNNEIMAQKSKSLKEKFASGKIVHHLKDKCLSENWKKNISIARIKYLESENSNVKWFSVKNINGKDIKVQGTWERDFALKMNELNILFERKRIKFLKHRTYTPDFYLPEFDFFIEIKGFFFDKDKYKMFLVLEENQIDLRLLNDIKILKDFSSKEVLLKIPKFIDICNYEEIDFSSFENVYCPIRRIGLSSGLRSRA